MVSSPSNRQSLALSVPRNPPAQNVQPARVPEPSDLQFLRILASSPPNPKEFLVPSSQIPGHHAINK